MLVCQYPKTGTPAGTRTRARGLGNRCSIHLSYRGIILSWSRGGSNPLPPACKAGVLPTELRPQATEKIIAHLEFLVTTIYFLSDTSIIAILIMLSRDC